MPDGCAMWCAICSPASGRGGRRAGTGRGIFARCLGSTRNCSGDAALPEPDWDVAGSKTEPDIHAVGPLIIILEIAARVLASGEAEDAVGHGRHLTAGTHVGRITAIRAEHVTLRGRGVVIDSGGDRPAAQSPVVIAGGGVGRGGGQDQPVPGIDPM